MALMGPLSVLQSWVSADGEEGGRCRGEYRSRQSQTRAHLPDRLMKKVAGWMYPPA